MFGDKLQPDRRKVIKSLGAGGLVTGLAGCTGDSGSSSGGNSLTEATWGGASSTETDCMECVHPQGGWEISERVNEESDSLEINFTGGAELCGEGDCGGQLISGNYPLTQNSITNATNWFPELDIFAPGYLVPVEDSNTQSQAGVADMIYDQAVLEDFWVPFANEYGVLPVAMGTPELRVIWMSSEWEGEVREPADLSDAEIRRTPSGNEARVLEAWGATPTSINWGETVQGMESGVVDGFVSWASVNFAAGAGPVTSQAIITHHMVGTRMSWVDVEWLKGLDQDDIDILAQESKEVSEQLVQNVPDVLENMGQTSENPGEDTRYSQDDIDVVMLDEEEMEAWQSPVDVTQNRELYSESIDSAEELAGDGVFDTILESAQSPSEISGYTFDAWWDDILDDIEV